MKEILYNERNANDIQMTGEEKQLVEACREGKLENFGRLYDLYADKIYRFIFYRVRHKETAQDLASQTFFKSLSNIGKFKGGEFSSWLYSIAKNTLIDYWRAARPQENIDNYWSLAGDDDLVKDSEIKERIRQAKEFLKNLDGRQREIVIMRAWDGLSYREISEILDMTEPACKMAFSRAIGKLRENEAIGMVMLLLLGIPSLLKGGWEGFYR